MISSFFSGVMFCSFLDKLKLFILFNNFPELLIIGFICLYNGITSFAIVNVFDKPFIIFNMKLDYNLLILCYNLI